MCVCLHLLLDFLEREIVPVIRNILGGQALNLEHSVFVNKEESRSYFWEESRNKETAVL